MAEFFAMDGYGAYVWAAYGLVAVVLGALAVRSVRAHIKARRRLDRMEAEAGGRK